MAHAVRRGIWFLGFGFIVCFLLLQSSRHIGRLSVVQPILTMELLFLVFILGTFFHFTITIREWAESAPSPRPLGLPSSPHRAVGMRHPPSRLIVVGGVAVASSSSPSWPPVGGHAGWKAAVFGSSAAIAYAFTAASSRRIAELLPPTIG